MAASEAYDAVEQGLDLQQPVAKQSKGSDAAAASGPAAPPAAPPLQPAARLTCYLCKFVFGVPGGAKLVRCPRCQTVNSTVPQPTGGGTFLSVRGNSAARIIAPAPPQTSYTPQAPMQPQTQLQPAPVQVPPRPGSMQIYLHPHLHRCPLPPVTHLPLPHPRFAFTFASARGLRQSLELLLLTDVPHSPRGAPVPPRARRLGRRSRRCSRAHTLGKCSLARLPNNKV